MSEFSVTLGAIIKENNINIYQLALASGIDRTTLHKVIKGDRTLKREQLSSLLSMMAITPHEKEMLMRSSELINGGETLIKQRQKVKTIIEDIGHISSANIKSIPETEAATPINTDREETTALYGKFAVNIAITEIIQHEKNYIYFSMPCSYRFFYDSLFSRYSSCVDLSINCFISFCKPNKNALENLDILESLIPFLMSSKNNFQANFIYSNTSLNDLFAIPFPYFIHTSRHSLLISANLDYGIFTANQSIHECYQTISNDLIQISSQLLVNIESVEELLSFYSKNLPSNAAVLDFIENQPCLLKYITRQMLEKYLINSDSNNLLEQFNDYIQRIRSQFRGKANVFTKEGLDFFLDTGIITILPPNYMSPFNVPDRVLLLRNMLNDLMSDNVHFRLIDDTKFKIPGCFSIGIINNMSLLITRLEYGANAAKNIKITEQSIVNAFSDFFVNLYNSEYTYTKEETIQAIIDSLKKLES